MTAVSQTPTMAPTAPEGDRSVLTRFVGSTAWSVFGAVVSRGLTLVGFVVAARLLGAAGFGAVGMVQSTQGLFGVLAGVHCGNAASSSESTQQAASGVGFTGPIHPQKPSAKPVGKLTPAVPAKTAASISNPLVTEESLGKPAVEGADVA